LSGGPIISVRYDAVNPRMGFNMANSNGFGFIGYNVNNATSSDEGTFDINGYARRIRLDNGKTIFEVSSVSGTAGNAITWNTNATIDTSGNLGLGVTPSAWTSATGFQVRNTAIEGRSSLPSYGTFSANGYTDSGTWKYISTDFASRYTQYQSAHLWFTAASGTAGDTITFTQAMTLDNAGSFILGDTTIGARNNNSCNFNIANGYGFGMHLNHATGVSSAIPYINFNYAASTIGNITQSGTTAVLYNTTSDQRLKENIQDADSASSLIDSLQVRKFDWKSDNSHQRYGFIAQELVTVAPEAVHQPVDEKDMMAVDYSKLVPMLIKGMQEQQALIQSLTTRLTALEAH